MMSNATRIKIAALTTALALGGLTAGGLAARGGENAPSQASTTASETAAQKPVVVHRRKVKTVVAKPRAADQTAGSVSTAARAPAETGPATVAVPESLGALRSDDDDERGDEDERGREGEDDD